MPRARNSVLVATWNVNSLRARMDRVMEWISYADPDILCLQETKMHDAAFPAGIFRDAGYGSIHHGDGGWNGVAILSKIGLSDADAGFGDGVDEMGCRIVSATCGNTRIVSVYVPNGREVGSVYYAGKLEWLACLRQYIDERYTPEERLLICGDFNIAPDDRDVWDADHFIGSTHVSASEREALQGLVSWGLTDCLRIHYQQSGLYSWWDYRGGAFHKHRGMRIDLVLATMPLAGRCSFALMDRNARKGKQPSDHVPVAVWIDT
ncbi:MAG: exodeoxyribonuclease III [Acidimicrobiales bacterium]